MSIQEKINDSLKDSVSRRGFMTTVGAAAAGVLVGSCGKKSNPVKSGPTNPNTSGDVSLAQLASYDFNPLKNKIIDMFDQIGGLGDVIPQGGKVAIKVNFTTLPVSGGYNFESFTVNRILSEVDAYVSIPKMKCHYTAGITLTMKNNVGMVPGNVYGDGTRWNLHGPGGDVSKASWHLPRTIVDLNLARPVDLSIIDGISTMDKGEGDWVDHTSAPYLAKALVAGKDPVKTDAVAMQVMGFDPLSAHRTGPFVVGENWLLKAQEKGLGDPDPSKITVAGAYPDDFQLKFHACDVNPQVTGKAAYHRMAPYCGLHPADQGRMARG